MNSNRKHLGAKYNIPKGIFREIISFLKGTYTFSMLQKEHYKCKETFRDFSPELTLILYYLFLPKSFWPVLIN